MRPDCLRPCASLRANLRHAIQSAVPPNSLRACSASLKQTAASQITMHWHSSVPMHAARTACRRRRHTGDGGYGRPVRFVTKLASGAYPDCASSYQKHKEAIPRPVLPLVPTPATVASWGWRLHRRVQQHRHQICGNVFERRATLAVSFAAQPQEVDVAGCPAAQRRGRGQ